MDTFLLTPPVAFLLYLGLAALLSLFGRSLAQSGEQSAAKTSLYASGEGAPQRGAVPGYRTFFVIALFFAVLHLGTLVLGTSALLPASGVYLVGLMITLLALILG